MSLRAFRVEVRHWYPTLVSVYAANNPAQARYKCWKQAQDAGFDEIKFADLRVIRTPEFDIVTDRLSRIGYGVDLDYAYLLRRAKLAEAGKEER